MTRRVWFGYELDHSNRPTPVLFYDDPPPKSHGKRPIVQVVELDEPQATFSFYSLCVIYPYIPQQETLQSTPTVVSSKELNMTRPVNGYMTKQGKFFESEAEANFYEAAYALNKAAATGVVALGVTGEENVEETIKAIVDFIAFNRDLVTEYLRARGTLEDEQTDHVVDGQSTEDNPPDDPSIRSGPDTSVAETPPTETQSQTTGEPPEQPPVPE